MKTIKKGNRVKSKANPIFSGIVIDAAKDGQSGYVHFDSDKEEDARTFFHITELELEDAK